MQVLYHTYDTAVLYHASFLDLKATEATNKAHHQRNPSVRDPSHPSTDVNTTASAALYAKSTMQVSLFRFMQGMKAASAGTTLNSYGSYTAEGPACGLA